MDSLKDMKSSVPFSDIDSCLFNYNNLWTSLVMDINDQQQLDQHDDGGSKSQRILVGMEQ